jgi:autotransporter translocation and assembly factor TamB
MNNIFGWILSGVIALIFVIVELVRRGRKARGYRLRLAFFLNQIKIEGNNMALSMKSTQRATGKVQPIDIKGNPAQVEAGTVEYTIDDPSLVEVIEDPDDETKFTVRALGPVGVTQLTIRADADLGEGVTTIETFAAIEITPAGAVGFGVTFDAPTEDEGGGGQ